MFWDNFVQLCTQQGKKPDPVAKELGIASGTVTEWRKGRIPQSVTLRKISDYFGVSVDALLGTPNANQKDVTTFKLNFIRLCNARGESPSSVCQKVGLSNAIFSQWTDETIPRRATLIKIADYLQVTVEELIANDTPDVARVEQNALLLTSGEHDLILEYRKNPSFAAIVDTIYSAIHPQQAEKE